MQRLWRRPDRRLAPEYGAVAGTDRRRRVLGAARECHRDGGSSRECERRPERDAQAEAGRGGSE